MSGCTIHLVTMDKKPFGFLWRYRSFLLILVDEIKELLAMRDRREAPCRTLLDLIEQKANQIEERIQLLKQMEVDLRKLHKLGLTFPTDDVDGKNCICHLVTEHSTVSARN